MYSLVVVLHALLAAAAVTAKPNIIVIIADDLGWNDVSFHGSAQIMTPNIDALAFKGLVLNRHYVQPSCSPSRASYLSARYPAHTGVQMPLSGSALTGLSLNHTLLPQYLERLGYQNHLVGKWHLGFHRAEYLPTRRGFHSHFGFWNGLLGYHDGIHHDPSGFVGIDGRRNEKRAWREFVGRYLTDVLTEEAVAVVKAHNEARGPLYLQVALSAPHTGNRGQEYEVRNLTANEELHHYIPDIRRRLYAGMVRGADDSVGAIMEALKSRDLLKNSIILFISDNGAPTLDPFWGYDNRGSNWPLRGMKMSAHEGGVRSAAAIWSPLIPGGGRVSEQLIHITDWLPTFYSAAGGDVKDLGLIDGVDQWDALRQKGRKGTTPRSEILVELNPENGNEAFISWPWKIVKYTSGNDARNGFAGDSGRGAEVPEYSASMVTGSQAARVLNLSPGIDITSLRANASLNDRCSPDSSTQVGHCNLHYCLFNLEKDPCETTDLSHSRPDLVSTLRDSLNRYRSSLVESQTFIEDPRSAPTSLQQYWDTWAEGYPSNPNSAQSSALMTRWFALLLGAAIIKVT